MEARQLSPSCFVTTRMTKKSGRRFVVRFRFGGRYSKLRHAGSFRTQKDARTRRDFVISELAAGGGVRFMVIAIAFLVLAVSLIRPASSVPADRDRGYERMRHLARHYHQQRDDLQRRLTRRVLEARGLRRALLHRASSLEALRLASIVYHVPFSLLYRRASCESTGSLPASPASERTLNAYAKNSHSTASGLLQFLTSTFASTPFGRESIWSPYANALAAGWMIGAAGRGNEWACR
jgi:hypothetical protein